MNTVVSSYWKYFNKNFFGVDLNLNMNKPELNLKNKNKIKRKEGSLLSVKLQLEPQM